MVNKVKYCLDTNIVSEILRKIFADSKRREVIVDLKNFLPFMKLCLISF